ncbi:MAG TPA: prepilin peptidase, partial [Oligoflexia bacterium]|nr:prepilin peptidase [Oligoflexia bacterium]
MSLSPLLDRLAIGWFGLIGLVVGSFLNVVIYRLPRGYLLSLPRRSVCANCKKQIRGYENIP